MALKLNFGLPKQQESQLYGDNLAEYLASLNSGNNEEMINPLQENIYNSPGIKNNDYSDKLFKTKNEEEQALSELIDEQARKYLNSNIPIPEKPPTAADIVSGFQKGYGGENGKGSDLLAGLGGLITNALKYLNTSEGQKILSGLGGDAYQKAAYLNTSDKLKQQELSNNNIYQQMQQDKMNKVLDLFKSQNTLMPYEDRGGLGILNKQTGDFNVFPKEIQKQKSGMDFQKEMYRDSNGVLRWGNFNKRTGEHLKNENDPEAIVQNGFAIDPETGERIKYDRYSGTQYNNQKSQSNINPSTQQKNVIKNNKNEQLNTNENILVPKLNVKQKEQWEKSQSKIEKDSEFSTSRKALDSIDQVEEILKSNNPVGDQAIKSLMPRALFGEVGRLPIQVENRFGGSQAIEARLKQIIKNSSSGTLTDENRNYLLSLINTMKPEFEKQYKRALDRHIALDKPILGLNDQGMKELYNPYSSRIQNNNIQVDRKKQLKSKYGL